MKLGRQEVQDQTNCELAEVPENPEMLDVRVWRGTQQGEWQHFSVPKRDNQTILDVVTWIQRHIDPGLSYRFACRVGMCGSCAMTVTGRPRWTCRTHVAQVLSEGVLEIGPLRNLPVIKDLAVDMAPFFEKWRDAGGHFEGAKTRHDPPAQVSPNSANREEADLGIECINCGVCNAACEVVRWNGRYLGPAALNRAWTLEVDERDQSTETRHQGIWGEAGAFNCHSHGNCTVHCPVGLDPARSIAGLKRRALGRSGKGGGT